MTNPALELAALFEKWSSDVSQPTVYIARGGTAGSIDFWESQGRAVELLKQVEDVLAALRRLPGMDTSPYDRHRVAWYEGIFQPDRQWGGAFAGDAAEYNAIGALKMLGMMINVSGVPGQISDGQRTSLVAVIDDAIDLLESESGMALAPLERQYIYRLLEETRRSLEERTIVGGMDLKANIDRLNGALLDVSAQFEAAKDPEAAERAAGSAMRIVALVRGIVYDMAAIGQILSTAAPVVHAIAGADGE